MTTVIGTYRCVVQCPRGHLAEVAATFDAATMEWRFAACECSDEPWTGAEFNRMRDEARYVWRADKL